MNKSPYSAVDSAWGLGYSLCMTRFITLVALLAGLLSGAAGAQDVIERFHSDVDILEDGDLRVTETIRVRAVDRPIHRGFRHSLSRWGAGDDTPRLGIDIEAAELNGESIALSLKRSPQRVNITFGGPNRMFAANIYRFTLRYRVSGAAVRGSRFDRLEWTVVRNHWDVPVNEASVRLRLPSGAFIYQRWLSPDGATGSRIRGAASPTQSAAQAITSPTPIGPEERFAVEVTWPKGILTPQSPGMQFLVWGERVLPGAITWIAFLLVLAFYVTVWAKPVAGGTPASARARTVPPEHVSPAASRQIWTGSYDARSFASAVISLAAKGVLDIACHGGTVRLHAGADITADHANTALASLSPGEKVLFTALFQRGNSDIALTSGEKKRLSRAARIHRRQLRREETRCFKIRFPALIVGLGLSVAFLLAAVLAIVEPLMGAGTAMIAGFITWRAVLRLKRRRDGGNPTLPWRRLALLQLATLALIGFTGLPEVPPEPGVPLGVGALLILHTIAACIPVRSPYGVDILARISGYRAYLLDRNAIDESRTQCTDLECPFRFERALAYAVALECEREWSESFDARLRSTAIERGQISYHPAWYHSHRQGRLRPGIIGTDIAHTLTQAYEALFSDTKPAAPRSGQQQSAPAKPLSR